MIEPGRVCAAGSGREICRECDPLGRLVEFVRGLRASTGYRAFVIDERAPVLGFEPLPELDA